MMRGMIGIHVLQFTMRTGTDPVTNATGMILGSRRDKTAIAAMAMMAVMRAVSGFMMCALIMEQCVQKGELRSLAIRWRAV